MMNRMTRERHGQLRHPGDDHVDPAAEVPGCGPAHDAEGDRDRRGEDRDLERCPAAVQQAQELVAALCPVAAEREEHAREVAGCTDVRHVLEVRPRAEGQRSRGQAAVEDLVGAVPEDPREDRGADEAQEDEDDDGDASTDRRLVLLQGEPDRLPVATRLDLVAEIERGLVDGGAGMQQLRARSEPRFANCTAVPAKSLIENREEGDRETA